MPWTVGVVSVAFAVGRMTADPAARSGREVSKVGFSGVEERFRVDCGLPRAFLKNGTVGLAGAVDVDASASDMVVRGR